jgi:hypothetical protein
MKSTSAACLFWAPRIAGILIAAFLGLFALDAFEGRTFLAALPALAVHLIPSFIVLAVVGIAWKFEWVGAVAFLGLAVLYALMVNGRLDWVAVISGPLTLVGLLFLAAWRHHGHLHAAK